MSLATNIRKGREKRGWSHAELAYHATLRGEGIVSPEALRRWEGGLNEPRAKAIKAIAAALEMSLDDIFSGG